MNELMAPDTFKLCLSLLTGVVAAMWVFYDGFNLLRLRNADKRDPIVRDKMFGYFVGMVIGILGVVGTLRFNDVV